MNLIEFQEKTKMFAMYSNLSTPPFVYLSLGIIGECGEVAEKIKKLIRDDHLNMTEDFKKNIAKELGDCIWYLASICNETNKDLCMMKAMRNIDTFHQIRNFQLPQLVLHMNSHSISLATVLQDWNYNNHGRIAECKAYTKIPYHISNIVICIEEIAHRCDFTLSDICENNIDKLMSRKNRGKLSGSGDNR